MGIEWGSQNAGRQIPSSRSASRPPGGTGGRNLASHDATRGRPASDAVSRPWRRRRLADLTGSIRMPRQVRPHLEHTQYLAALARATRT